jgi:hypothetical protein
VLRHHDSFGEAAVDFKADPFGDALTEVLTSAETSKAGPTIEVAEDDTTFADHDTLDLITALQDTASNLMP